MTAPDYETESYSSVRRAHLRRRPSTASLLDEWALIRADLDLAVRFCERHAGLAVLNQQPAAHSKPQYDLLVDCARRLALAAKRLRGARW